MLKYGFGKSLFCKKAPKKILDLLGAFFLHEDVRKQSTHPDAPEPKPEKFWVKVWKAPFQKGFTGSFLNSAILMVRVMGISI